MKSEMQLMCETRLRNVLVKNKEDNPLKIKNILKSELLYVLKNYMEVTAENIDLNITINNSGYYQLDLIATARRIKPASSFIDVDE